MIGSNANIYLANEQLMVLKFCIVIKTQFNPAFDIGWQSTSRGKQGDILHHGPVCGVVRLTFVFSSSQ